MTLLKKFLLGALMLVIGIVPAVALWMDPPPGPAGPDTAPGAAMPTQVEPPTERAPPPIDDFGYFDDQARGFGKPFDFEEFDAFDGPGETDDGREKERKPARDDGGLRIKIGRGHGDFDDGDK